ncbi:MAG: hypothetical protein M1832_004492 [Thelocarpon impressellum]|nr:MAG: hypothetical protein M1832_004492 [Thelocarpon impressellum]
MSSLTLITALSLGLLCLLPGANSQPAASSSQTTSTATYPVATLRSGEDKGATPGQQRHPSNELFMLQVQYIQDGSRSAEAFNQTAPTFLNLDRMTPSNDGVWEIGGSLEIASHFQNSRGMIFYTGWPKPGQSVGEPPSDHVLKADFDIGKLTISRHRPAPGKAYPALEWDFDGSDNLVMTDRTDPRMKLCRKGVGARTGNLDADRLEIILGNKLPAAGTRCQNIRLRAVAAPARLAITYVADLRLPVVPNPSS